MLGGCGCQRGNRKTEIISMLTKLAVLRRIDIQKYLLKQGLYMGQLPVLEYVIHNEGCGQKELSKALSVSPASIAQSTKRMQRAGLLDKEADENNLRCNRIRSTPRGRAVAQRCRSAFNRLDDKMFRGFEPEELEEFAGFLDRLIYNVSGLREEELDFGQILSMESKLEVETRKGGTKSNDT